MKKNPAFENSLACLQHPLTLFSIATLLLNDHVLKVIAPSWLTGKLSDFAGLFFFPFVVAAGMSLALSKFNLSRQRIGQIAFGLVAVWFVLLKTSPLVNSLTAQLASLFIGGTAQLILDPTDLIALMVMWPARMLWQNQSGVVLSRKAYVSLAVGVLACLATSRPAYFDNVIAFVYQDSILYAKSSGTYEIAQSLDHGVSWNLVDADREEQARLGQLFSEHSLPFQICDPVIEEMCYMVDGTDKVYISNDRGASWQVGWEILRSRREYVLRTHGAIAGRDLIIVEDGDDRYLIVAMDTNGILRRKLPDGEWTELPVEKAQPATVFYSPSLFSTVDVIIKELVIWYGVAFLALLITNVAIWNRLATRKTIWNLLGWLLVSILSTLAVILVEAGLAYLGLSIVINDFDSVVLNTQYLLGFLYVLVIVLAILTPFIWQWLGMTIWILKTAPSQKRELKLVFYSLLTVIGVYLIGTLPWPLWAMGIIESYQWTLFISISVSALITALGYRLIRNAK